MTGMTVIVVPMVVVMRLGLGRTASAGPAAAQRRGRPVGIAVRFSLELRARWAAR